MIRKFVDWLDGHLIPQWREGWRFFSVQLAAIAAAVMGSIAAAPDMLLSLVAFLPHGGWLQIALIAAVVIVVFVVPTVGRLWDQSSSNDTGEE